MCKAIGFKQMADAMAEADAIMKAALQREAAEGNLCPEVLAAFRKSFAPVWERFLSLHNSNVNAAQIMDVVSKIEEGALELAKKIEAKKN